MNRTERCLNEAEMIDAILGHPQKGVRPRIHAHLAECRACRDTYDGWRRALADGREEEVAPPPVGWALRLRVLLRSWRLRSRRHRRSLVGATALMLLGLCLVGLWTAVRRPAAHEGYTLAADESIMRDTAIVSETGTRQVRVMPAAPWVKGYAWVNPGSREVLIMLGGVDYEEGKDYQVWTEHDGARSHLGLMKWSAGTAHLLYRGDEVRLADRLSVSLEPKGGSTVPTGPELASVQLKE